jgi:8-oxo-dGTP pyrophosphatase MutT (NUDIX family)
MSLRSVQVIGSLMSALLATGCAVTGDFGNYQAGEPAVFVVEQNDERNSVRLLDLPIFTLFEYTRDKAAETVQVAFVESPLFKIFSRREENQRSELRFVDLRLFALFRKTREADTQKLHLLKLPFIGSLYGHEIDGDRERRNLLFLSREGPLAPPEPEEEPPAPPAELEEEPPAPPAELEMEEPRPDEPPADAVNGSET